MATDNINVSSNLTELLQKWTGLVQGIEKCNMLDEMRKYDFTIDAHDSWVEFGYDELLYVQKELEDRYDIKLHYENCFYKPISEDDENQPF